MRTSFIRCVALVVAAILTGCAVSPDHDAKYMLSMASSNFSRGDNANAAWFLNRATTKPYGRERVREYFETRPELIEPYFDGAIKAANTTESQESIDDTLLTLDVLEKVSGVRQERIAIARKACRDGAARIALLEDSRRDLSRRLAMARSQARITCAEREQCDRAFGMAGVFVSENADMKIQIATSSVIETYNARDKGKLTLKVLRTPQVQNQSEIALIAACRTDDEVRWEEPCELRLLKVYTDFRKALLPFSMQ